MPAIYMQIEDEFGDVVGKARRGQEIDAAELCRQVGLTGRELERLESYEFTPGTEEIAHLAQALHLHPQKLQDSAGGRYFPLYPAGRSVTDVSVEMLVLGTDFLMNGYVVACKGTGRGIVVDPGFDAEKILKAVDASGLEVEQVLLTHGHGDHTGALSEVCQATGAPARINAADCHLLGSLERKVEGQLVDGDVISVGQQRFAVAATPGHTAGGVSLVHDSVAIVGDALFAGSLGGTRRLDNYRAQMAAVGERILLLDEHVILYPGHGPATTVGEERVHNPFFQ